jgi:HK97 family phage major capsid protein
MKTSVELREERAGIVTAARTILDLAKAESRDMTTEEEEAYDRHMVDVDKFKSKIDRIERLELAESELEAPGERRSLALNGRNHETRGERPSDVVIMDDFRHYMKTGETRASLRNHRSLSPELRDTIIGTDAKGGYLVAPVKLADDIVKLIDDMVFIRRLGTVTRVTDAKKLGIRKMITRMADADWTTEVGAVTEDTTMAWDRRDLEPYLLTKLAKMSLRTMYLVPEAESEVKDELSYKFGLTEEKAFLTGNGTSKPLGVFTASASGISTGRDVTALTTHTTTFDGDDLISIKYALKAPYRQRPSTAWVMHRDAVAKSMKLKDTTGQYLWAAGLVAGQPDRLLDLPLYESEWAPNTFTAGLYYCVLGDFKYYRIAEVIDLVIQRLTELYAATNEIGFIGRRWVDGAPVLEEAFARGKLALT